MAIKDDAVVTAAQGYIYINKTVGAAAPTPAELEALDPETFGCQQLKVVVSATATSYELKVGTETSATLDIDATPDQVQSALEALEAVGAGNVIVSGTDVTDANGLVVIVAGEKAGKTLALTGTATGSGTPTVTVTVLKAPLSWNNIGHTSRDDLPEFGFDGGDTKVTGSWQKKRLREIADGDPVEDSVTMQLEQWDVDSFELYFGKNASTTPGVFGVSGEFAPIEAALLIIIVDGPAKIGFYAPKASIKRDDSVDMSTDDFAKFPIKATFLDLGSRRLYDWISLQHFA